jgi:3-deoxy-manno-octulosonate cytidylyltransferase (CMP-KDO synthetase)
MVESLQTPRILGVIPARFGSQRFPGKLLAQLAGKTVLQRTFENASRCPLFDALVIATDDERIEAHARDFGAKVAMTPVFCTSGTERIATLLEAERSYDGYSLIVNIQGDEPCLPPSALTCLIQALQAAPEAVMATLVAPLHSAAAWQSTSVVKCLCDQRGNALYFSRAPLPGSKAGGWHPHLPVYRHIGVYAYRRPFLLHYRELKDTPLQLAEDLEQLKVLEHGYSIATACVQETAVGVDTPEDLQTLEQLLCHVNLSSPQVEYAPRSAKD